MALGESKHGAAPGRQARAIVQALGDAQRSLAKHNKASNLLWRVYTSSSGEQESFRREFITQLDRVLAHPESTPAVDRLLKLYAKVLFHRAERHPSLSTSLSAAVLRHSMSRARASDRLVRTRATELLGLALHRMPESMGDIEDGDDGEDLFEDIAQCLIQRSIDKTPSVRQAAIAALGRLQAPNDPEDAVVFAILRGLSQDSSKDVRKAAVEAMAIAPHTLPALLLRARDAAAPVRAAAFANVRTRVPLRILSPAQRVALLFAGLRDRAQGAKRAATELAKAWLAKCDGSLLAFAEKLSVEDYPRETDTILLEMLRAGVRLPAKETPPFARGDLTPEMASLWKAVCRNAAGTGAGANPAAAEAFLPDAVEFAEILKPEVLFTGGSGDADARACLAVQIVEIGAYLDIHDEVGRHAVDAAARNMLANPATPEALLPALVALLRRLHSARGTLINNLLGLVAAVRGDRKVPAPGSEVDDSSEEASTWGRALALAAAAMRLPSASAQHGGVYGLIKSLILPLFQVSSPYLREHAMKAMGLACLLRRDIARAHMGVLIQAMQRDVASVQIAAIRAVIDLILAFPGLLPSETSDAAQLLSAGDFRGVLVNLMSDSSRELRALAAEGLAKLFLAGRADGDARSMSVLIAAHVTRSPVADPELCQTLAVFFARLTQPPRAEGKHAGKPAPADREAMWAARAVVADALPAALAAVATESKALRARKLTLSQVTAFCVDLLNFSDHEETAVERKGGSILYRAAFAALARVHAAVDTGAPPPRALLQFVAALPLRMLHGRAAARLAACLDAAKQGGGVGTDKQTAKYVTSAQKAMLKAAGGAAAVEAVQDAAAELEAEANRIRAEAPVPEDKSARRKGKRGKAKRPARRSRTDAAWDSDQESPSTTDVSDMSGDETQ